MYLGRVAREQSRVDVVATTRRGADDHGNLSPSKNWATDPGARPPFVLSVAARIATNNERRHIVFLRTFAGLGGHIQPFLLNARK